MKSRVLSTKELNALLKVKTTSAQARQIIRRNSIALEMLQNGPWPDEGEFTVKVGCPHCNQSCRHCAYPSNGGGIDEHGNLYMFGQCLHYKFGGVSYYNVNCIIDISRDFYLLHKADSRSREYKDAITWLKGHIEWAEAVLKRAKRKARS